MRIFVTSKAAREYKALYPPLQALVIKAFNNLAQNLRHPSLHAKKFDEGIDMWQARVNDDYRFYFQIVGDLYYILEIRKHPK